VLSVNTMKTENEHNEFRTRVVKYLSGEMQPAELAEFEQLLESDSAKKELFDSYRKIWDGAEMAGESNRYDLDAEWSRFSDKLDQRKGGLRLEPFRRSFLRVAAAILIGLAGVGGWLVVQEYGGYTKVASVQGKETIELNDGSLITLNEGSTLRYSMSEKRGERKVFLTGEAFFEVARDTVRPFIVVADETVIEVLGTSFNVRAYKETETIEVTVQSGLVSMSGRRSDEEQLVLQPGNTGLYNRSGKSLEFIGRADPNSFAWKTRELVFSETPLSEVVEVVSRVYGVSLQIGSEELADCPLTVSFSDQEFPAVLNVIQNTFDLKAERRGGSIYLTGPGCE
jgi:transmembrane sensor